MKMVTAMVLILMTAVSFAGDKTPWVDMAGCPICMNVSSQEGLMDNMTWEHFLTATGVMIVSTVKSEYQPKYAQAKAGMKEQLGKVLAGEDIEVCGYCTSLSSLLKDGAKAENFMTKTTDMMLISSTDEAMIARIHTHSQKTIDFLKSGHQGHDH